MSRRYLIDTHCWLWWNGDPGRLSGPARSIIADGHSDILFSVASAWEISIKHGLGKLALPSIPAKYLPARLSSNRIQVLPVLLHHALAVGDLPQHHCDPFDRILIAQALAEDLVIITADEVFQRYDVPLL